MKNKKIIMCVCRGNILRSAVAEKLIERKLLELKLNKEYMVVSRSIQGTAADPKPVRFPNITYYNEIYPQIKPVLDEYGIDLTRHVSTPIDNQMATDATLILAMDKQTQRALEILFPEYASKIRLFARLANSSKDVTDVDYHTGQTYQVKVVRKIKKILDKGVGRLVKMM